MKNKRERIAGDKKEVNYYSDDISKIETMLEKETGTSQDFLRESNVK